MNNWTQTQLKTVCTVSAGQGAPQSDSDYADSGTPFIKAGNLNELLNGKTENELLLVSEETVKKYKLKKYSAGSVVFAKSGMSCTKGYVYTLKQDAYVVSHLAILSPFAIKSEFLNYYLRFIKTYSLIKDAAYPTISLGDIENMSIPVPSLEEQERIVSILDEKFAQIDKLKENADKNLQNARELLQSKINSIFEDSSFPKKSLGSCGVFKNGMNFSSSDSGYSIFSLGVGDFKDNFEIRDTSQLSKISLLGEPSEDYLLKDGDIIFVRSNGNKELVGRCLIVYPGEVQTTYSGFCIRFRKTDSSIDSEFLVHFMKTDSSRKILNGKEGANISNLNQKILSSFEVPVPSIAKQKEIVLELNSLYNQEKKLEEIYNKQVKNCEELKQSFLNKAFSGEL